MTQRTSRKICSSFLNAGYRYLPSESKAARMEIFSHSDGSFVILWSNRGIRFCNTDHIRRSQRALACPAVCRNGCSRCTSGYPVLFPLHIWQGGPGQQRTAAPRQSYRNRPARWQNCSKQTDCFFGGHARKRTALSQKRQSAADHGGFRPQGLSKEFGGGHMLGNDTGTAVVGAHQLPSEACVAEGLNKETGTRASKPLHRRIDSSGSIMRLFGPACPCPPGISSYTLTLAPIRNFSSGMARRRTFSQSSYANRARFSNEPPYFQQRSLNGRRSWEPR